MNAKRTIVLALCGLLSAGPMDARAEGPADDYDVKSNVFGEAAEATVGRVFGVEGDASNIKYHVFELTQHSPASAAARSAVLPGWGQHFNQQRTKGIVFFLATLGAVVGSAKLYGEAREDYDDYKARGQKDNSLYDDYEQARTGALVLGGAAAVLWVVGIFDAHRNAYQSLYSKKIDVDIAMTDQDTQIVVRKSF